MKRKPNIFAAILAASGIIATHALAADGTWTQTTSGGLWSDTANWSGGTAADGSGFTADFTTLDITTDNTVNLDAAVTIGNLTFGDTDTATAAGWIVADNATPGNILTLAGASPTITVGALGTDKGVTISAEIAGSDDLIKTGAGTLTLSGFNSFTGRFTVTGGTLAIAADSGLGYAPVTAVADQLTLNGGTLQITAASQTLDANRGITLGASGGTIDTSVIAGAGITTTVGGVIDGTGALTLKSTGNLSASGGNDGGLGIKLNQAANTFTGDVTVASGLVSYANDASFGNAANKIILNGGGLLDNNVNVALSRDIQILAGGGTFRTYGATNVTWSSTITGSGNINRTDGGTLALNGNLAGYTGTFTNQSGNTLFQTGANALAGTLTITGGSAAIENSATNAYSAVNLNGGTLRIKSNDNALGSTTLAVGGNATLATQSGSSAVTLANAISITDGRTLSFDGGYANLTLNGGISVTGSTAATTLANASSGTTTLGGTVNLGTHGDSAIQNNANGNLVLANGSTVTASDVRMTSTSTANIITIESGATLNAKYLNIGNGSGNSGRIVQTGGLVTMSSGDAGIRLGHWSSGANPASSYAITGGTLDATGLSANDGSGNNRLINVGWDGAASMTVGGGAGAALVKAY